MSSIRILLLGILFVFLFLEVWLGFPTKLEWGSEDPKIDLSKIAKDTDVEKSMQGAHMAVSREGNKDWEMFSQSAEGYGGAGSWKLKNVKVKFYSEDKVEFTVTGENGIIDSQTKDMEITGNVLVQSANGHKIQTQTMKYISEKRKLKSLSKVKLIAPKDKSVKSMVVDSDWFDAFVDENVIKLHENVKAEKVLNDGRKLLVNSKEAEFYGNNRTAKFAERVLIEIDSMRIEGPEAKFQYKEGESTLQSVQVKGGVKVSDLNKYATSELIQFDPEQNRFTLTGRPRVVQNNDEILGDQITFIDGGKKVKVENMKARVEKTGE